MASVRALPRISRKAPLPQMLQLDWCQGICAFPATYFKQVTSATIAPVGPLQLASVRALPRISRKEILRRTKKYNQILRRITKYYDVL